MNCLCNLFDNEIVWVIVIALILIWIHNGSSCGCGNSCGCAACGARSCG